MHGQQFVPLKSNAKKELLKFVETRQWREHQGRRYTGFNGELVRDDVIIRTGKGETVTSKNQFLQVTYSHHLKLKTSLWL